MASAFRGTLDFMNKLGVYDVILPFLLIFTIVFAILEKTKLFGTEEIQGVKYTKKNLDAMAAFVIAFFVVASSKLVETITKISSNMIILLLGVLLFLMLYGSFQEETEKGVFLTGAWNTVFAVLVFAGLALIFLDAIKTKEKTWLQILTGWIFQFWDNTVVATIVLIIIIIGIMAYVVGVSPGGGKKEGKK
jgi:hypothetical protein